MALEILYRDDHYIAIDKPAGMLVHRSPMARDRVFVLQSLRDQIGRHLYPIHRLDRATTGVLVFALTPTAARRLVTEFESRRVDKRYLAVTRGWLEPTGLIDHPVGDAENQVPERPARTRYRCVGRIELPYAVDRYASARYSLAEVVPETGRRQQIRKHFKHVHHPLIGDTTHGNGRHNRFFRQHFALRRLLLMAVRLRFRHPFLEHPVEIRAQPDHDWQRLLDLFNVDLSPAHAAG